MVKWTYCTKDIPEYSDLLDLGRAINYNKRRMMSILAEPRSNGFDDVFSAREMANLFAERIDYLHNEYRYMVHMHIGDEGRIA